MKTLVISVLLAFVITNVDLHAAEHSSALINRQSAATFEENLLPIDQKTQAFLDKISFQISKVNSIVGQYERSVHAIKAKPGGSFELQAQMEKLIRFNYDENGQPAAGSEAAIAEIRAKYGKMIKQKEKAEAKDIAKLNLFLERELERERRDFNATKKTYTKQINAHTQPLIKSLEERMAYKQ